MKLSCFIFSLVVAMVTSAWSAAVPVAACVGMDHVLGNLSYAFGWTMAGAATSTDELDAACNNIRSIGHGKWANESLVPELIREPFCNLSHTGPNATIAVPWTIYYNTEVFASQLLNSFYAPKAADDLAYLCDNIRYLALDGFHMDSARLVNATCEASGQQISPRPVTAATTTNETAVQAYKNELSILNAVLFASSATSDSELNIYCAHSPEYVNGLDALGLNGTLMQDVLCGKVVSVKGLLDSQSAMDTIQAVSSRLFIMAVEGMSNVDGYLVWLCNHLSLAAMDAVGLDGRSINGQVCMDAGVTSSAGP